MVAYALAGTVDLDLTTQPIGVGSDGEPVYLRDIWPSDEEIAEAAKLAVDPALYRQRYENINAVCPEWNAISAQTSELFNWDADSTYIQKPPFFDHLTAEQVQCGEVQSSKFKVQSEDANQKHFALCTLNSELQNSRCLIALGDSVTTDHISPAGSIKVDSPAGRYLREHGVAPADFNSYGSRRGNDRVMTRGTFANIRIRNLLAPGTEGGVTQYFGEQASGFRLQEELLAGVPAASNTNSEARSPKPEAIPIYDAAVRYQADNVPLIVLAGKEYGTGSSRDWAAKGTMLLGIRAVIASSFERIHRGNLVGMGVLPLQLRDGVTWQSLGLTGEELFDIPQITADFTPGGEVTVTARQVQSSKFKVQSGEEQSSEFRVQSEGTDEKHSALCTFPVKVRIDTPVELVYYLNGGIMPTVLRKLAAQ